MAKGFNLEFLRELKERNNIVEVIGSYVTLDRKGDNYWACCPFHHEKTPSFCVNESGQFYHCFGCHVSGDVINFVKEIEMTDFLSAVKILADRARMQVPEGDFDGEKTIEIKRKKDVLLKILNDSAHFYLKNLNSGNAEKHIDYIVKRGISSAVVRKFGFGASLNLTDLPNFLLNKGYSRQDIIDSGVAFDKDGKLYDSESGRLIIPIIDAFGQVVAFGGRILEKSDFAKYKNTKETLIFNKSKTLYNINQLKKLKNDEGISSVIIVEGYMDTISLFQAGFKNVVASMGTSLTKDQARILKRYSDNVFISYDGDFAGQKATIRGLEILRDEGLNVKVVSLPDGLDPDDVIKKQGVEGYQKCLDESLTLIDFKLKILDRYYDISKSDEKRNYLAKAIEVIKEAPLESEREDLIKKVGEKAGVTFASLQRDVNNVTEKAQTIITPKTEIKESEPTTVSIKAQRFILASVLFDAYYTKDFDLSKVKFDNDVHSVIKDYLIKQKSMGEKPRPNDLFDFFEDNKEIEAIFSLNIEDAFKKESDEKYFYDCVRLLKVFEIDKKIEELTSLTKTETEIKKQLELAKEIQNLQLVKKNLK